MTTTTLQANETIVDLAGLKVRVLEKGSGPPLLVIHHDIGSMSWTPFYEALAAKFHTYVPDLPGWGGSDRPEWARHVRDISALLAQLLDKLGLEKPAVVGLGYGGWIAAELATFAQSRLSSLVLVGPMGIQPRPGTGEIMDQYMIDFADYVAAGFSSPEASAEHFGEDPAQEFVTFWDFSREMTARITWKPYMFSQQLPPLLKGVNTPTLVVLGDQDKIVPVDSGKQYVENLPNAKLEMLPGAGHLADLENPDGLANLVIAHLSATTS
jgi:pimeloyl-ACP methyl ester carboxylesterase